MFQSKRESSLSWSQDRSRLAIIHREGSMNAQVAISVILLLYIISLVRFGRLLVNQGKQANMLVYIAGGLIVYLVLTIVIRQRYYHLIVKYQGLSHPKLLTNLTLTIPTMLFSVPPLSIVVTTAAILTSIDVLVQNQLHDYAILISKFSITTILTLPVFHIPFQKHLGRKLNKNGGLSLGIRDLNDTGNQYLHPSELNHSDHWYEIDHIQLNENLAGKIMTIYRAKGNDMILEFLDQAEQLIDVEFFITKP